MLPLNKVSNFNMFYDSILFESMDNFRPAGYLMMINRKGKTQQNVKTNENVAHATIILKERWL